MLLIKSHLFAGLFVLLFSTCTISATLLTENFETDGEGVRFTSDMFNKTYQPTNPSVNANDYFNRTLDAVSVTINSVNHPNEKTIITL